jgi:hypothetical protein
LRLAFLFLSVCACFVMRMRIFVKSAIVMWRTDGVGCYESGWYASGKMPMPPGSGSSGGPGRAGYPGFGIRRYREFELG